MKKLNLNLENIKVMLSKEEMVRISGGEETCRTNEQCKDKCEEKISGSWTCNICCIA